MKVLLLATNTLTIPYPVYPIGLDYVAGALAPRHQVEILDLGMSGGDGTDAAAEERVRAASPDVVGLSLRNMDTTDAAHVADFSGRFASVISMVRRATRAPVVMGGSAFNIFPAELMGALDADYGIIGEGERLPLLLEALEKKTDPAAVPGVIVRGGKRAIPPLWDGPIVRAFDAARPHVKTYLSRGGMLNIQTKRGCPLNCIYCTYPLIDGRGIRCFDPDAVGAEARGLQNAGAKFLYITDSSFNVHPSHSLRVAEAFRAHGVTVPWGGFFTPVPMPEGYYQTLRACGLTHVEFGTDALSDSVLRSYKKPFTAARVLEAHRVALEAGLHVSHYILLGGPGETEATLRETLEAADRLERCVLFFFFGMRVYPGTDLHALALSEGKAEYRDTFSHPVFYRADAVGQEAVAAAVKERARGRLNWIIGSGGDVMDRTVARMHSRGATGPLWEKLIG